MNKLFGKFGGKWSVDGSGPGHPEGDTASLVPVVAMTEDMLLTSDGAFVVMLEMPPLDIGLSGQDFARWAERYELALEKLPPGTTLQMTVLLEPHDETADLAYFVDSANQWGALENGGAHPQRKMAQAAALASASEHMTASLAAWFDETQPVTWRSILTLHHRPGLQGAKSFIFSRDGQSAPDIEGLLARAPAARDLLQRRLSVLMTAFAGAGIPLRLMAPGEMCQALWRALHPAATCPQSSGAQDLALELSSDKAVHRRTPPDADIFHPGLSAEEIQDLLAPDTVLEREGWIEIDGVKLAGYVVHDFRPNRPAMIHRLVSLEGGWSGSLHIEVADPAFIANKLRTREVQLAAQEHAKAQKGLLPSFSSHQEVGAVQEQRMRMETSGQTPIFIRLFVTRSAEDERVLAKRCRDLESLLTTIGAAAFPARHSQLLLWKSTFPLGNLALNQRPRNMTPGSLGTFFWPAEERLLDPEGVYIGIDERNKLPVRIDPFGADADRTPSYLVLGRPGAGKSVMLRSVILSSLLSGGRAMAIDVEGEMQGFCERYGGRYIEVGTAVGERVNVLDIPPDSQDPLLAGTEHLIAFCEAVRGQPIPKGREWNGLAEAYQAALEDRGWLTAAGNPSGRSYWKHEDAPRLSDIARILETAPSETSRSLAEMLRPYAQGVYAPYFNTPTTFDIAEESLVVFGLQHVNAVSDQLRVYLWQVMGLIWGEVIRRHATDPSSAQHVFLDEVWKLMEAPGGGAAIENMARRFRKRRTALWMASQEVGEFLDSDGGRRILSVVGNTFLMEQRPVEARRLQETFSLSDHVTHSLQRLGTGHGILVLPEGNRRIWVAVPEAWQVY